MEPTGVKRKLAVILAADVEGYSRLMGADEEATLSTLSDYREIIDGLIARHEGRIVGTAGDSVLAEFGSAVEAVRSATAIQEELATRNAELPEDRRMRFRIGINVGDVMVKGDDLFGDGVNVAARLEGLAEAGGICISGSTFEQVKNKLSVGFEDIGPQEVKNIAEPVPAFRLVPGLVSGAAGARTAPKPSMTARWRIPAIAAGAVVVVAVAGVAIWDAYLRPAPPPPVVASEEAPVPQRPDKPSIAVLPFKNLSGDPEQEYFSDGITNDIITDLSKFSNLFVIASNSTFTYKARPVKVEEIGRDLGVRYVLEGSVQKAGDKVRINAQLIDVTTGGHLWAERYDRDLKDVFALQDEIAGKIVAALEVTLTEGEQEQVARRYTDNLEAYDNFLRGRGFQGGTTKEKNAQARQLLERAIELDPKFAGGYAELSWIHFFEFFLYWSAGSRALERAFELAQKAVALDDSLPDAHARLGWIHLWRKQYEQAIAEGERGIALDPNYADGYLLLGHTLIYAGRPEEGIASSKKGMRLDPHSLYHYLLHIADGYWMMGQYEEAVASLKRSVILNPDFMPTYFWIAAIHSELGREEEARAAVAKILRIIPGASVEAERRKMAYKDPAMVERFVNGLRKAGMPEKSRSAKL